MQLRSLPVFTLALAAVLLASCGKQAETPPAAAPAAAPCRGCGPAGSVRRPDHQFRGQYADPGAGAEPAPTS